MIPGKDLTRWNRSGLTRFRYVDGNAATFLEVIRAALAKQDALAAWKEIQKEPPDVGLQVEHKTWIEERYALPAGDWGWELARTLARAVHVLAEHIDAYANEGYLETATQWENVRRLVETIDYHPAPPASSFSSLALQIPDGRSGTLEAGFAVQHSPEDGSAPIVFETLEDLDVHADLNALRLPGWNHNPRLYRRLSPAEQTDAWRIDAESEISVGDLGVVLNEGERKLSVVSVGGVDDAESSPRTVRVNKEPGAIDWTGWALGDLSLRVTPKQVAVPHLNGPDVVTCAKPHGFSVGDVIAWNGNKWTFGRIAEVDETSFRLLGGEKPSHGDDLYIAPKVARSPEGTLSFSSAHKAVSYIKTDGTFDTPTTHTKEFERHDVTASVYAVTQNSVQEVFLVHQGLEPQASVVADTEGGYVFDGGPGDLKSGDWVVGEGPLGRRPFVVISVLELEDTHRVWLGLPDGQPLPDDYRLARRNAQDIQGVGTERKKALDRADLTSIRDLEAISSVSEVAAKGIHETWVREIRTKARLLLEQREKLARLAGLWTFTLDRVAAMSSEDLALKTGLPIDEAASVRATVRLMEALLDQEAFRAIRMSDLAEGDRASTTTETADVLHRLYGPFENVLRPVGHDRNSTPVTGAEMTLDIASDADLPAALAVGRSVIVEKQVGEEVYEDARLLSLVEVDRAQRTVTLSEPLLLDDGCTLGNTVIRTNVVRAGHGEKRKESVLGSGDAKQNHQRMLFEVDGVSFVADASQTSGVRADIAVRVDGRTWKQVSSLRSSRPTDPHYTVRMTAEGFLLLEFGDGTYGRRLPSGTNNVRIRHREGTGLSGNLDPGSLAKPVRPGPLVDSVRQPLPSAGGAEMEGTESLRASAPSTLLALERAVSLADFGNLATSQSSVWQARAFQQKTLLGRHETVEVVVVPAGGGEIGELAGAIEDYLQAHALPGVRVQVSSFERVEVDLSVTMRVKSDEYEPEDVQAAVRAILESRLSVERRKLGAPLYRSEIYAYVESVSGVENCVCEILAARDSASMAGIADTVAEIATTIAVAGRPTHDIQGVGEIVSSSSGKTYEDWLAEQGVPSIGALAVFDPEALVLDSAELFHVARARLWEFRVKARALIELSARLGPLAAVTDRTLRALAGMSAAALRDQLGLSDFEMQDVQKALGSAEILLDQGAFRSMRVSEFAAGTGTTTTGGAPADYPKIRRGAGGVIRSVWPSDRQVVYFDPRRCRLDQSWEEFEL